MEVALRPTGAQCPGLIEQGLKDSAAVLQKRLAQPVLKLLHIPSPLSLELFLDLRDERFRFLQQRVQNYPGFFLPCRAPVCLRVICIVRSAYSSLNCLNS